MKKLLVTALAAACAAHSFASDHLIVLDSNDIRETVVATGMNFGSNSTLPSNMAAAHFVAIPNSAVAQGCENNRLYVDLSDGIHPSKTRVSQSFDYHLISQGFENIRAAKQAVLFGQQSSLTLYYTKNTPNNAKCLLKGSAYK